MTYVSFEELRNEGREEGREEGVYEHQKKMVIKLLERKIGIEAIAELVDLEIDEVKSIMIDSELPYYFENMNTDTTPKPSSGYTMDF